jgi:hypothetical protein
MRRKYRFDDTTQTVRCELVLVFNEHEIDFAEIEVNCDFDEEGRRLWDAEMQSQLARSDELAWKSFRRSHGDRAVRVRGLMPLPSLPAPTIYDRRSRAVAYPALELRSGTWSVTWFRSKADADASQAAVSKAKTLLDEREEQRRAESGHHIKAAQKQPAQRSGRRARRALAARKDDCSMESRLLQLAATFSKR